MSQDAAGLADQIRSAHLDKPFGTVKFWGMAVMAPGDQSYVVVSSHADGDRLDLSFVHESRAGLPGVISVWAPEGLEMEGARLVIRSAARLRMDDNEATREGESYRIRTARGEGVWPITEDEPALILSR